MARHAEEEPAAWWSAEKLAALPKEKIDRFFVAGTVVVEIDTVLAAKASAGAEAIRPQADSRFHPNDLLHLYHHEATVHTAAGLNGRRQPHLRSLALGAPRAGRAVREAGRGAVPCSP